MNAPRTMPDDQCADAGTHIPRSPRAELNDAVTSLSVLATLLANRRVSLSSALLSAFGEEGSQKRQLKRAIHTVLGEMGAGSTLCPSCEADLEEDIPQ